MTGQWNKSSQNQEIPGLKPWYVWGIDENDARRRSREMLDHLAARKSKK
jgi:hypothetical protein